MTTKQAQINKQEAEAEIRLERIAEAIVQKSDFRKLAQAIKSNLWTFEAV